MLGGGCVATFVGEAKSLYEIDRASNSVFDVCLREYLVETDLEKVAARVRKMVYYLDMTEGDFEKGVLMYWWLVGSNWGSSL
jgi:hypothetical protein